MTRDGFFDCCAHCGCGTDLAAEYGEGHDDTCASGCNDPLPDTTDTAPEETP